VTTKETRVQRGRRRGQTLSSRAIGELRDARITASVSQERLAEQLGRSSSAIGRLEANELEDVGVIQLAEMASVLGLELSLGLHPIGDPIRDKGQLALGKRFDQLLSSLWRVTDETLLPGQGELRAWDKLLRLVGETPRHLVGVDLETRIRDMQALVRRTRLRERDGQVDAILLVLSDSATNRRLVEELRTMLGPSYASSSRSLLDALRRGVRLVGSGVVLV
jgi:transcriptional regulator with XRE-family HTH domain